MPRIQGPLRSVAQGRDRGDAPASRICADPRLMSLPIVYTIRGCDACVKLLKKWEAEGVTYDERRVELNQATLDEARGYGMMVPIIRWPDGRVEQGFEGSLGCFI